MSDRLNRYEVYAIPVPKLWSETIETHRHEVSEAIMETTWSLAVQNGPMSVTMSQIAQQVGIGRATLYKYFPDVETILYARHERHVLDHLARLNELRQRTSSPGDKLEAVALAYAQMCHHRAQHGTIELSAYLHKPEHVAAAEKQLLTLFEDLLSDAGANGHVRDTTKADELAVYCVHALAAAGSLQSDAAVRRLVTVTLAALRP